MTLSVLKVPGAFPACWMPQPNAARDRTRRRNELFWEMVPGGGTIPSFMLSQKVSKNYIIQSELWGDRSYCFR
jgi:hypothetical protein